jgi:predicted nucleotidyltransferase
MNLFEQVQSKRGKILKIASLYGAYNVRLFGSVARGEEQKDSDIDFLVDMESGRSLLDLGGLLMDLQELLDHPVDVVTKNGLKQRIKQRVLREALPL